MKRHISAIATLILSLSLLPALAQPGGQPGGMGGQARGPGFGGAMARLFGDNTAFSATVEMTAQVGRDQTVTTPGKIAFLNGESRFEMDLTQTKSDQMPPNAAEQMKAMGMDKMIVISVPEKKTMYIIYPSMKAYAEMPIRNPDDTKPASDFKMETTELGKETVDGHPCVKNKAVVTDDQGAKHESLVWNATDLKKFPVKIEATERGHKMTMLFKDVKLSKPASSLFDPPSDYKKYDNIMTLMQQEVMKRMGGQRGMPPQGE